MNITTKSAAVLAIALAGILCAEGRPQQNRPQDYRSDICPRCGQSGPRQRGSQYRQPGYQRQFGPARFQQPGPRYGQQAPQQQLGRRHRQHGQQQQFGHRNRQPGTQQRFNRRYDPQQQAPAGFQQPAARYGRQHQPFHSPRRTPACSNDRLKIRQRLMERFDRNGDGRLSGEERQAARNAWEQRQQRHRDAVPQEQPPAAAEE